MTTETSTEQDEALHNHIEAFIGTLSVDTDAANRLIESLAPHLAAIRRHAAAEALREQAARLGAVNSQYIKRLKHYDYDSDAYKLTFARAGQASADAARLRNAAHDIIAEGWEHACAASWAATRDDPGYGCDTPVEHEGDYCPRHEPEDDEDRWAD